MADQCCVVTLLLWLISNNNSEGNNVRGEFQVICVMILVRCTLATPQFMQQPGTYNIPTPGNTFIAKLPAPQAHHWISSQAQKETRCTLYFCGHFFHCACLRVADWAEQQWGYMHGLLLPYCNILIHFFWHLQHQHRCNNWQRQLLLQHTGCKCSSTNFNCQNGESISKCGLRTHCAAGVCCFCLLLWKPVCLL